MKPATLLALPALALAAATPAQVEERQLPVPLPDPTRLVNLQCVTNILQFTSCFSLPTNPTSPVLVSDLVGLATCPGLVVLAVVGCLLPLPLPVPV